MAYGAISEKDEKLYTYLPKLFDSIQNAQEDYNWLITDCSCNIDNPIEAEVSEKGYCWISGEDLTKAVRKDRIYWLFGVLCGFPKDIPLQEVLKFPLPFADGYPGFWQNPISMQHPLAVVEIVPWDASCVLLISTQKALVDQFKAAYALSEDLSSHNSANE